MGFTGAEPNGMFEQFDVRFDDRGRVAANDHYVTSDPGIFTAEDMHGGQSLIVWVIANARQAAAIHRSVRQQRIAPVR